MTPNSPLNEIFVNVSVKNNFTIYRSIAKAIID